MRSMGRSLAALAIAFVGAAYGVAPAHADGAPRWLLLPVLTGDQSRTPEPSALTRDVESELRAANRSVLANVAAAEQFESQVSAEPVQLGSDELKRASQSISRAARHLALGELPEAQRAAQTISLLSAPARDFLNRDPARARKIFDNCVMTAYLYERA